MISVSSSGPTWRQMMHWEFMQLGSQATSLSPLIRTCARFLVSCLTLLILYKLLPKKKVIAGTTYKQWLETTDGYSGVPSIGVKRANALLDAEGCTWETVVKAFKSKDEGEDIALQNARLAKILQYENYPNGIIELWTPPMPDNDTNTEQDLKLRQLQDLLPSADKEDIITLSWHCNDRTLPWLTPSNRC